MEIVDQTTNIIPCAFGVSEERYDHFFEICKDRFIEWHKNDEDKRDVAGLIRDLDKELAPIDALESFFFGFAISSILEQAQSRQRNPLLELLSR